MDNKLLPGDLFGNERKAEKKSAAVKKKAAKKSSPEKKPSSRKKSAASKPATPKKTAAVKKKTEPKKKSAKKPATKTKSVKAVKKKTTKPAAEQKKKTKVEKKKVPVEKKTVAPKKKAAKKKTAKTPTRAKKKTTGTTKKVEKTVRPVVEEVVHVPTVEEKDERVYDFPWEYPDGEEARIPCPACGEPVHPDARVCIHCGSPFVECPHCKKLCAALSNPKMETEQRLNKIFKQYTLFSLALPALPIQPILDCSCCHNKMVLCEQCRNPMRISAQSCPSCGTVVRRTKLIINPFNILDTVFRRPDVGKTIQKGLENFLRSISEW